jgi:hypothetical protein
LSISLTAWPRRSRADDRNSKAGGPASCERAASIGPTAHAFETRTKGEVGPGEQPGLKPARLAYARPLSGHYGGEGAGPEGNIKPDEELFQAELFNFQSLACSSRSSAFATKTRIAGTELFNQWAFCQQKISPSLSAIAGRKIVVSRPREANLLSATCRGFLDHEVFQQKTIILWGQRSTAIDAKDGFIIHSIGL